MYKAQMVDSGNITGTNIDTYYFSFMSLRSIRTIVFIYELNNIETCTGDISKAHLNAPNTEKIVLNSGPNFAPFGHAGHLLIINSALYVLKSYGFRFHSRLSDDLISLVSVPSMGGYDIWMRNKGD